LPLAQYVPNNAQNSQTVANFCQSVFDVYLHISSKYRLNFRRPFFFAAYVFFGKPLAYAGDFVYDEVSYF
jgi:hypothetical protein